MSEQLFDPFSFITVEPRFYDRRSNDIPDLTINIPCPSKSYSKLNKAKYRFSNIRLNDIPGTMMEI